MDHQKENSENRKNPGTGEAPGKNRKTLWVSVSIKKWCIRWRDSVIDRLERIDHRLNNQQRKWLFYLAILICSSLLLSLVGAALRSPDAFFVPPILIHKKQPLKDSVLKSMHGSATIISQPTK